MCCQIGKAKRLPSVPHNSYLIVEVDEGRKKKKRLHTSRFAAVYSNPFHEGQPTPPKRSAHTPFTMPSTFEKTRKAIAKKKGPIEAVHQFSRDSRRLHRAQARDEKLDKIAAARRKADKPYSQFFS